MHNGLTRPGCLIISLALLSACRPTQPTVTSSLRRGAVPTDADFIQFRWIEEGRSAGPGGFTDPQTGEALTLSDTVWLDVGGIDSAMVRHVRGQPAGFGNVVLLHSRAASATVGATTATHIGRRFAIVIDGKVTNTPIAAGAFGTMSELVSNVPQATADSLAARVNAVAMALRPYRPVFFKR